MKVTFETDEYIPMGLMGNRHLTELTVKLDGKTIMESNDIETLDSDGVIDHLRLLAISLDYEVEDR